MKVLLLLMAAAVCSLGQLKIDKGFVDLSALCGIASSVGTGMGCVPYFAAVRLSHVPCCASYVELQFTYIDNDGTRKTDTRVVPHQWGVDGEIHYFGYYKRIVPLEIMAIPLSPGEAVWRTW